MDLPIAIGILLASGQIAVDSGLDHIFMAEFSLNGKYKANKRSVTCCVVNEEI